MKKMCKLLSLLLAVMMLLTSTAVAEGGIPMAYAELSDIEIIMDGESLMDLSALKLKLGAGASENELAVTADLYAGEVNAASAVLGMAENVLVGNVEGMSVPVQLALTEENLAAMTVAFEQGFMGEFNEEEQAALQMIFTAVQQLAEGDTTEEYAAASEAYMNDLMTLLSDKMTVEESTNTFYADMSGEEQAATITTIVLNGEDMVVMLEGAIKMYETNPAFMDLLNGCLMLEGEQPIESLSAMMDDESRAALAEEMLDGGVAVIDVYMNEDGTLIDIVLNVVDDAEADDPAVLATVDIGVGVTDSVIFVMQVADEDGDGIYAQFDSVPSEEFAGEMETSVYMEETDGDETETLLSAWIGPDPDFGTLYTVALMPDSEYDMVGLAMGIADGQYIFSMYDNDVSMEMGYIGESETEGLVYLSMDDGAAVMELSAAVTLTTGEYPLEKLSKLAKADGIDLMTATEEDFTPIVGDLQLVLINAAAALVSAVPDLGVLMGME